MENKAASQQKKGDEAIEDEDEQSGFDDDMFSLMQQEQDNKNNSKDKALILMQLAGESTAENSVSTSVGESIDSGKGLTTKSTSSLEKYEVFQEIGEGAFGLVNLAKEKATGQIVAIKAVNIARICQLNKERHILREKELFQHLKHNNIIQLYATFKDDTNLYFVFENGPRGTLDDIIKKTGGLNE